MNKRSATTLFVASACLIGLAACAGPTDDTSFPQQDLATTPDGSFPIVDNLRMVDIGMTKQQVYPLIGPPHFHESVFRVRVWNYLFHFRDGEQTVSCRYQIQFDDHSRVSRTRWQDPQCERFAPAKIATDAGTSGASSTTGATSTTGTTEKVQ